MIVPGYKILNANSDQPSETFGRLDAEDKPLAFAEAQAKLKEIHYELEHSGDMVGDLWKQDVRIIEADVPCDDPLSNIEDYARD
ncbi:MAG: hypothetical protein COA36_16905 [Desulfotalea sp.]|nr:MAG: hypothetical protein COA36_16905 [Desulfotalea sp.]